MDTVWIVTTLTNVVMATMGWFLRTMHLELKELRRELQTTRETYVHRDEIRELKNEMVQRFDRVEKLLIDTIRRQ